MEHMCAHTRLSLYSHLKVFLGNGVRTHVNSREISPLPEKFFSEEDQTHDAASRTASPTHYKQAIPAPSSGNRSLLFQVQLYLLGARIPQSVVCWARCPASCSVAGSPPSMPLVQVEGIFPGS